ncbi:NAD-dependent epimerase/dehydratase family protein [Mycolicibacterium sp. BiH015]|uniref:NAD-dependent epimerase/dehydratase family protein n=1 Tax=Mycolicibacterium sp. BiH015 TaxID=3018808 RepID=UPI0022E322B2|nr:NAD-dependent epimerase/dehydratase family protein [Mycolicibacterium sp. BiH015]MDA2892609.1 NAD-dependent epimerase/dehydratase family protein [Mycolicibacterium sp. BiH015]
MAERVRRIVVTGASGNVGAGVLRTLARLEPDAEVIGVCRRPPPDNSGFYHGVHWYAVDLSAPDAAAQLVPAMRGSDVVIHLALAILPVDDEEYLYRANVLGTQAVLDAMTEAGVGHLVYASSLGIYSPGPGRLVSEESPTAGQGASTYSRHKVLVESLLDDFEARNPGTVVSRFRPTVVVQRDAASEIRSLYLGPFIPRAALRLLQRRALPVLPLPNDLSLQFVHADDVGDAVIRLMQSRARGSFNIASDVLDRKQLAALVGARPIDVDPSLMRRAVVALHRLGVVAVTPGWYDVATRSPLMDTAKARQELGWSPARPSTDAARELIDGLADGAIGGSAAMGLNGQEAAAPSSVQRLHDASLLLWCVTAVARAANPGRPRPLHGAFIATNLVSGTPAALARVQQQRRDPVALAAPVAVAAAVLTSLRGGRPAAVAAIVLGALGIAERRHIKREAHG